MKEEQIQAFADKHAFRRRMKEKRDSLSAEDRKAYSEAACRHLINWLSNREVESLMCYAPFRGELDIKSVADWAWQSGIAVIMPRSDMRDHSMSLHQIGNWSDLTEGAYGILEPDLQKCPPLSIAFAPSVVVAPGLSFDQYGGRMGYGGGYYDRFAERLNRMQQGNGKETLWIGAAYGIQLEELIPMQPHDQRMDGLVTENGMLMFDGTPNVAGKGGDC
ncbi:5-formyltetrahydrofolate cyclo-ligase [Paenibacillus sp. NPDC058071]|uniref:5-formyltetrahydrofolate cyclo-ligase n=1 Tax=Paenibacillus sp. NPDC058071 TaxID=3346326 RepID=UPI0036DC0411